MVVRTPVASRHLRDASARLVLEHLWDVDEVTGSALIEATGLSRATVHDVCDELIEHGWVTELESQRTGNDHRKGRPARRYAFDARAGVVVGVDAGQHRISATVTDLRGDALASTVLTVEPEDGTVARRLALIEQATFAALEDAGASPPSVLALAVGVPAPVDRDGRTTFQDNPFWELMNPDIARHLRDRHGWTTLTDNDANLAAMAEHWRGHGAGARCHVTLLAGERFGAGVVDDGRLLRGAHGGVGEMRYLDFVEGVGSADGIAAVVRADARAQLHRLDGQTGSSQLQDLDPATLDAASVFAAALDEDPLAVSVVEHVAALLARVVATFASIYDPERVIIAGAVAESCGPLLELVRRDLDRYVDPPGIEVLASELGRDIVTVGAVKRALDHVRAHALEIAPARVL